MGLFEKHRFPAELKNLKQEIYEEINSTSTDMLHYGKESVINRIYSALILIHDT
jgi:hypothetical protein